MLRHHEDEFVSLLEEATRNELSLTIDGRPLFALPTDICPWPLHNNERNCPDRKTTSPIHKYEILFVSGDSFSFRCFESRIVCFLKLASILVSPWKLASCRDGWTTSSQQIVMVACSAANGPRDPSILRR